MENGKDKERSVDLLLEALKKSSPEINITDELKTILKEQLAKLDETSKLQEKALRDFNSRQISFIEKYVNRRFDVSSEFYNAALQELRESFRWGEERGMLAFFKETDEGLHGEEFYGSDWLDSNHVGFSSPHRMWITEKKTNVTVPFPLGSYCFDTEKLSELSENRDELLIPFHTHPTLARPSSGDLSKGSPYLSGIIGFTKTSLEHKKLVADTFAQKPKWVKGIPKRGSYEKSSDESNINPLTLIQADTEEVRYRVPFEFPENVYTAVLKECVPTARLFYTDSSNTLQKIHFHVDGKMLP